MSANSEREGEQDPAPIEHSDAERVKDADDANQELDDDPARNPRQPKPRDVNS